MRLKVMFRADALPIFYRHLFMGIIKEAIRKTDNEYYQHLYFYQHKTNKAARPFCFAVRFPFDRVKLKEKERFYLQGPGQLHLSTPDPFLFTCLYNGLLKIKKEKIINIYIYSFSIPLNIFKPSSEPSIFSLALSGCGINPNTFFCSLQIQTMQRLNIL